MKEIPQQVSESVRRINPHLYQKGQASTAVMIQRAKDGLPMIQIKPKRIRQSSKPLMNKLEGEFYNSIKSRFEFVCPQAMRFMLGNGIWYKPDFICFPVGFDSQDTRMRAFEVKGPHAFRGGFENLKVAAHNYVSIIWILAWKEDGQWKEQRVLP